MNQETAIDFLRQHQPMPPDDRLTENLIAEYDAVRQYFQENPDPACISLLLNSFGDGSGFGVYQLVEDVITQFPAQDVMPHLVLALKSPNRSVRYWCAQIAALFPSPLLIEPLEDLLQDDTSDIRSAAVTALENNNDKRIDTLLEKRLQIEQDSHVRDVILDTLKYRH